MPKLKAEESSGQSFCDMYSNTETSEGMKSALKIAKPRHRDSQDTQNVLMMKGSNGSILNSELEALEK